MIIKKTDKRWIRYIKHRINANKNFLCMVTGATGSGKSWATLSICEQLNDDFNIARVVFKGKELMVQINSKEYDNKKGIALLWDEAGIGLNAKNFMSVANRVLNYLIQTFRHRNFILFFTSPHIDFLDSATRKMFHARFETMHINKAKGTVRIKPKVIQYNGDLKKYYQKYLRTRAGTKIKKWDIPKPSEKLIEDYENKKLAFTKELNADIENKLDDFEVKDKPQVQTAENKKPVFKTPYPEMIIQCWERGIFDLKEISSIIGIHHNKVTGHIATLAKNGIIPFTYKKMPNRLMDEPNNTHKPLLAPIPT